METASLLAIISGVCWATNITIVKWALNRSRASALVGATVGVTIAAIVSLILALVSGSSLPDSEVLWKFAIVGIIAPAVHKDYSCHRWFYRACPHIHSYWDIAGFLRSPRSHLFR
ncbi:MAG: hypothetical protein CM15mP49_23270 [Actinomycetota bacterium]|nr:MAG: hypothetical protein CM15mP49_23270 [Actinomycetota bacterium]